MVSCYVCLFFAINVVGVGLSHYFYCLTCLNKQLIMSFLDKFKGRTSQLSQKHFDKILPNHPHTQYITQNLQQSTQPIKQQNLLKTNAVGQSPKGKLRKQQQEQKKQSKQSPFYVLNPFYLDQLERQRDQRAKREQEIKQRLERQKKKRLELEAKLAESNNVNKEKYSSKQWIQLGGLGPNIGTQEWLKKNELHNKMINFSKSIKKINFQKIKVVPFVSLSHLHKNIKQNPRTKAIEYSHSVPRPRVVAGGQIIENLPRSESKEELSEFQKLNLNHLKYVELMKKL